MLYRNFFTVVQYKYEHPRISVEWHTKYFYYQPVVGHIFLEPLSLYGLFLRLIISLVALFGFFSISSNLPSFNGHQTEFGTIDLYGKTKVYSSI